ncbi:unnamed protein product [Eruca vesicaria subsp. sativa]|uniref:Uncharacterized protein n=1 Tax=Eruca vesicaria subsp. sativa TaxID=29727 RepID=A0ABC8L4P2_ERUVS|nr:unnamed protein product [Eruca vesicaria subsp. sativa]
MDRSTPEHNTSSSHKRLSVSFLVSLMVLCARHANRLSKKLKPKKRTHNETSRGRWNTMRSPRPKEFLMNLTNTCYSGGYKPEKKRAAAAMEEEEEHGLWQREILMGGKCEPLDFSGVIYYDCNGQQLRDAPPRSPRRTPLPIRS